MEFNEKETEALRAVENASANDVKDLGELELALVGGGMGDVSFG